MAPTKMARLAQVSQAFTPSAPIDDVRLFADRPDEVLACIEAFFQKGRHIALYGERGVGKTSLANVVPKIISNAQLPDVTAVRIDCNTNDNYNSIWCKIYRALQLPIPDELKAGLGQTVDPEDIRFALEHLSAKTLIVVDEFDRVENDEALSLLADTVKTLSDHASPAKLMFVGVAASIENLLGEHESIIRNVQQVPMPRMSVSELAATLEQGFAAIDALDIEAEAKTRIIHASEGLPHFAHVLGLHAAQHAVKDDRDLVVAGDVQRAEADVMRTHSMVADYRRATQSPQPGHCSRRCCWPAPTPPGITSKPSGRATCALPCRPSCIRTWTTRASSGTSQSCRGRAGRPCTRRARRGITSTGSAIRCSSPSSRWWAEQRS